MGGVSYNKRVKKGTTLLDYQTYQLVAAARTRNWAIILTHLLCAPLASAVYSSKQKNPLPFLGATAVFILGIPFAMIDLGLTSVLLAPTTSVVMLCAKGGESRRRLGVMCPEQADALLYNNGKAPAQEIIVRHEQSPS